MHLPDGYLAAAVWIPAAVVSGLTVAVANRRVTNRSFVNDQPGSSPGSVAALTAFVFAAQALQFPIPGGAAGHLLGGTLLATLLGPARAILAMSTVFSVQAVVFHDGGLTTLGANLLNGGILPVIVGHGAVALTRHANLRHLTPTAASAGAFLGVLTGAVACSFEVALSGTAPLAPFFGAMLGAHLWIALGEAVITASLVKVLTFEPAPAPTNSAHSRRPSGPRPWIAAAMILTVVVASELWSSRAPDGLESAARQLGLPTNDAPLTAPPTAAAAMAFSAFGALACGLGMWGVLRFSRRRSK